MKKTNEQIEKEQRELKIIKVIFDEDEDGHLRDVNFEKYLKRIGKENLGKQVEEEVEGAKKLTKEQKKEIGLFEEAQSSGYQGSFSDFQKVNKK